MPEPIVLYGATQSYFTRKMSGYLDYKDLPWRLKRFLGGSPEVRAAGWSGGIPAAKTPEGEFMWDTTAMILHLEHRFPEPAVVPDDPVLAFLCFLLEDFSDEWLYRPAVGSRWLYEENTRPGSWDLARDLSASAPVPLSGDQAREMVTGIMQGSIARLGATAENIDIWIEEVLQPWQRVFSAHLEHVPYLLGARPSLADFAFFGGNAAHFVNDPLCRRWSDEVGPGVVAHTHRLLEPQDQAFGSWLEPGDVPETLVACVREIGRHYLPWVASATVKGRGEVFEGDAATAIDTTDFLNEARGVLLARYVALRTPALDALLERAGVLRWLADFTDQAGAIPPVDSPPRPALNQPFPARP